MIPSPPLPRPLRHVIWLGPLLVACLAWQFAGPIALDAAAPHGRDLLRGFYAPESGPHGAFRWSERDAAITLPVLTSPAALLLRGAVAPDGTRVEGILLTAADASPLPGQARTTSLPRAARAGGGADTFSIPGWVLLVSGVLAVLSAGMLREARGSRPPRKDGP